MKVLNQRTPIGFLAPAWAKFVLMLAFGFTSFAGTASDVRDDFVLNLNDTDISVFIQTVSEITGKNFVIDPRVQGKVTVVTATPTTAEKIYEIFLSALSVNGYVAVPSGDVIKIVPDAGAMQRASRAGGAGEGGDHLVTRIIQVENVGVQTLTSALKPLLPPTAHMSGHPEARMIVIADSANNVERMAGIIARIDAGSDQDVDVIVLRHADASQIIDTLNVLQQGDRQRVGAMGRQLAAMVADTQSNSILLSGPATDRARLRELIAKMDVPAGNLRGAQVVYLKHAVAVDMKAVLKGIGDKLLKARAGGNQQFEIEADEATNAVILTAPGDLMAEILSVINKLDVPRAQVQVEGIIAEISNDRGAELGLQWQTALTSDGVYAIQRSLVGGSLTSGFPAGVSATDGFPNSAGGGLSLGYFSGGDLRALLTALASDSTTNILSTPTVVTLDNKKALIHIGQNVPIVTGTFTNDSGSDDPFQTIERRDVGIKLQVTPQINEGDTVRLSIRQEVSSVDPSSTGSGLVTNERTIETTVQVEDGEIIALGGLISDDVAEQKSSIPYVGAIPVFGELFTTRRSTLERRNLVIFLRPTILGRDSRQTVIMRKRYRQMRELQLKGSDRGKAITHMSGEHAAVLPEYPPAPDKPIISMPSPKPKTNEVSDQGPDFRDYPFFEIE